ncbi:hypothetical protein FB451DRAFT_1391757 [Mycena latifolia]|nr:hypothetical protein FB451DRAFT_1391757 [Mycena latifolia]
MTTAMEATPNEVWLRIFALVDHAKSLGSVVLACRKFHFLGSEALVRHVTWRSSTVAINHLEFWERNPSKAHLSFSKLNHLTLLWGALPDILYHTLQHLPSLTHLTLESCSVPPPPAFFPFSFPSTVPPPPIQVTTLTVSKLKPTFIGTIMLDAVTIPLAYYLPKLQAFVTDTIGIQIPTSPSARLSSLTLTLPNVTGDIQPRLDILLHRMPALSHLHISIAHTNLHTPYGAVTTVSQGPSPTLPLLRVLSAPWPAVGHLVPGAPALTHLRVLSPIGKPGDAIWLLERLRGAPVRSAALRLHTWDDEVLLAAARCLPGCAALAVAYQHCAPAPRFLFDLGIHHLPLLTALHTLRLFALPRLPAAPPRFVWDAPAGSAQIVDIGPWALEEEREAEKRREGEEVEAGMSEYVHAWTRYNPALRRVQLGVEPGRAWVRRQGGAGWDVDALADEEREEAWTEMFAEDHERCTPFRRSSPRHSPHPPRAPVSLSPLSPFATPCARHLSLLILLLALWLPLDTSTSMEGTVCRCRLPPPLPATPSRACTALWRTSYPSPTSSSALPPTGVLYAPGRHRRRPARASRPPPPDPTPSRYKNGYRGPAYTPARTRGWGVGFRGGAGGGGAGWIIVGGEGYDLLLPQSPLSLPPSSPSPSHTFHRGCIALWARVAPPVFPIPFILVTVVTIPSSPRLPQRRCLGVLRRIPLLPVPRK